MKKTKQSFRGGYTLYTAYGLYYTRINSIAICRLLNLDKSFGKLQKTQSV